MTSTRDTPTSAEAADPLGAAARDGGPIGVGDPIGDALAGLDAVLARLEGAVARRLEADADPDDRDVELALMDEDRARLAAALDAASARLTEVEGTVGAVGRRLDRAIDAVAGVVGRRDAPHA